MHMPRLPLSWALLLCAGLVLLAVSSADARPIRTLDLDRDIPEADLIALVKIEASTFKAHGWFQPQWKGRRTPTPTGKGYKIDFHDAKGQILLPIKGSLATGSALTFRHRREPSSGPSAPNGFISHAFEPGMIYLLVLRKESDGVLAVPAPEQWFYTTYAERMVATLPKRPTKESDLRYVLRLLFARFDAGTKPDEVGVDSLAQVVRSTAGLALAKEDARKDRICTRLERIVNDDLGTGTHARVLWLLKELGRPVPTKKIMNWILDGKLAMHVRMNLVGMLSHTPTKEQIAALDRIIEAAGDSELVRTAARQRNYARALLKREQEAERRIRAAEQR